MQCYFNWPAKYRAIGVASNHSRVNMTRPNKNSAPCTICAKPIQRGFTLIEMVLVVVLIGILASIAYPSYSDYLRSSRRADASSVLLESSQYMERYFTETNTYVGATLPTTQTPKDGAIKFYNITFATGQPTASTYTLQATPINTQSSDPCGTLSLTQSGVKSTTGSTVAKCWKQ